MDDSTDFTFCQVGSPNDDDAVESPKGIPNVERITLDDGPLEGENLQNTKRSTKDDIPDISVTSLKFSITDSTTQKKVEAGGSCSDSLEKQTISKKPVARAKVPFEKGYSQMDWMKLTNTHPDLAGLKGQPRRLISMDEVRKHKTEGSVWTVLKGRIYNISPYMKFHPGGVDMLMKAAGKDCTSLFNKYHAWVNAEFLLEKCLVGFLDDSS